MGQQTCLIPQIHPDCQVMNVAAQKYNVLPEVRTSDSAESVSFTKCIPDVLARTKEPQPPSDPNTSSSWLSVLEPRPSLVDQE